MKEKDLVFEGTPTQELPVKVGMPESIPRYRQILKKELPESYLKPDNVHLLWFIPHIAIIVGSLWLLAVNFSWWLAPLLSLLIGHSFACLGFLAHEICHGGAIPNRKLRHFLAGVGFSPFGIGPHLWSRWHNAEHHGHTQHENIDPDHLFTLEEYKKQPILKALYKISPLARNLVVFSFFSVLMSQHNYFMVSQYVRTKDTMPRERAAILFQFLFPKLLWIVGTLLLGWEVFVFGYVFPLLIGNAIVISYIATNHFLNPLANENDVLATSLSVTLPRWMFWLDSMHLHFGAHVAHHLFPQAPSRYTRRIEDHIARLWPNRFHRMPLGKALKLLWNTPWIYAEEGTALIDPQKQTTAPTLGYGLE